MKIIQTFWTGPAKQIIENPLNLKGGWRSCEFHWMSWALSCLQAKKLFGKVEIVTDETGAAILAGKLKLPYDSVSTALEGKLDGYPSSLFSLAKIFTYQLQNEPFLHIDGDVFLWQKPDAAVPGSRLIAQNIDKDLPFYAFMLDEINRHFDFIPPLFLEEYYRGDAVYAANAGVIGGNDHRFFKAYARQAFEFIDNNKTQLDRPDTSGLNFIFEQYLFYHLAKDKNIGVTYVKDIVDDPIFKDYVRFEDFPDIDLVHPVGNFKKYPHICDHLAKKLRNDYPEYYYRIVKVLRDEHAEIASAIYYTPGIAPQLLPDVNTTPYVVNPQSYEVAQASLVYLSGKYEIPAVTLTGDEPEILESFAGKATDDEKKCLYEIFKLEGLKAELAVKWFGSNAGVAENYQAGKEMYRRIQESFLQPESVWMSKRVEPADHYLLMETGWQWKFDHHAEISAIVRRNFNEGESEFHLMLLPEAFRPAVREFYLDPLDKVVFDFVAKKLSVAEILQNLEDYFNADQIKRNYPAYKKLVVRIVRQLLYAGAAIFMI